jgi:hypothetical protein
LQYNACAQTNAVTMCASDNNPCSVDQCSSGTCTHAAGNAGALCGESGDVCIDDAFCTGSSTACPAPTNKPANTACDDNNPRTTNDVCNAGICRGT